MIKTGEQAKSDSVYQMPLKSRLYISSGHNAPTTLDNSLMRQAQEAFFIALEEKTEKPLQIKFQHFEKEDHGIVPLPSLYHELLFAFEGYPMPFMFESEPEGS